MGSGIPLLATFSTEGKWIREKHHFSLTVFVEIGDNIIWKPMSIQPPIELQGAAEPRKKAFPRLREFASESERESHNLENLFAGLCTVYCILHSACANSIRA